MPPRRRRAGSAGASRHGAGSRAGSNSAAGTARPLCSPVGSRSSSSSTRRRRSPPVIVRARCVAAPTTSASASCGATSIPDGSAPMRSTPSSIWSATAQRRAGRGTTARSSTTLPDGVFVLVDGEPHLVRGARLLRWTPSGYVSRAAAAGEGAGSPDHAAVARGRPAVGVGASRAARPPVGPRCLSGSDVAEVEPRRKHCLRARAGSA